MHDQAIARLWQDYYPRLVFYIRHAFPGLRGEAEDLCQEAFLRAQTVTLVESEVGSPRAWLYAVARNLCIDRLRQNGRSSVGLDAADAEEVAAVYIDPAVALDRQHTQDAVAEGIARLEPADREICYLYYFEDLKVTEIGRLIRRPSGTVKFRLFRIRAALKRYLEARHEN